MNTPPSDEAMAFPGVGANIKKDLIFGDRHVITKSWQRLLQQLKDQVKVVGEAESGMIPIIDFADLDAPTKSDLWLANLKTRGVGVVRNVIEECQIEDWIDRLDDYLRDNTPTDTSPKEHDDLHELFWSPPQVGARAHPNLLATQRLLMRRCWTHSADSEARISTNYPVTCADRMRAKCDCSDETIERGDPCQLVQAHGDIHKSGEKVHDDSACPNTAAYRNIWSGEWEAYDPWDVSARLNATSNPQENQRDSGAFRLFEGMLALSPAEEEPPIRICSLPLSLITAYRQLRPLFSPRQRPPGGLQDQNREAFLDPSNWAVDSSRLPVVIHGVQPEHSSGTTSTTQHPHLELEKTLSPLPRLRQGDYVVWHPDTIYTNLPHQGPPPPTPQSPCDFEPSPPPPPNLFLHVPACPLTSSNAEFLARQRRAFILGMPGPDFSTLPSPSTPRRDAVGESCHLGRPGVQEVHEAGGEDALRAMGLLAWDEDGALDENERALLKMANTILFPDGGVTD